MKVEVTIEIDDNVVMSAVESGLRHISQTWGEVSKRPSVMGSSWTVVENDPDLPDAGRHQTLGRLEIIDGVKYLAMDEPAEYAKLMTGNADEHTGSLIVQYGLWSVSRYV